MIARLAETRSFLAASAKLAEQIRAAEAAVLDRAAAARRALEARRLAAEAAGERALARLRAGEIDEFEAEPLIHGAAFEHRALTDELAAVESEILGWRERGRLADPALVVAILDAAERIA